MNTSMNMVEGNLALDIYKSNKPSFSVVSGGLCPQATFHAADSARSIENVPAKSTHLRAPIDTRLIAALTCMALGCALIAFGASIVSSAHRIQVIENVSYERIRVRPGESVWSISEDHPVDGLSTQDIEDLIQEQNGLQRLSLQPGDTLLVPSSK